MIYPILPVQGCRWPGPIPAAQDARQQNAPDRMPPHHKVHSHPHHSHSWWNHGDVLMNPTGTSSRCGRKSEDLEKTQAGLGKACRPHTDSVPGWKGMFYFYFYFSFFNLIHVLVKTHWMKQCFSKSCSTYLLHIWTLNTVGTCQSINKIHGYIWA